MRYSNYVGKMMSAHAIFVRLLMIQHKISHINDSM